MNIGRIYLQNFEERYFKNSDEFTEKDVIAAYIGSLFPNIKKWKYLEFLNDNPWNPIQQLWFTIYIKFRINRKLSFLPISSCVMLRRHKDRSVYLKTDVGM